MDKPGVTFRVDFQWPPNRHRAGGSLRPPCGVRQAATQRGHARRDAPYTYLRNTVSNQARLSLRDHLVYRANFGDELLEHFGY
jgi:hypothetical protein